MRGQGHIIDIDSIVLSSTGTDSPGALRSRISADVRRALEAAGLHTHTGIVDGPTQVAAQVATSIASRIGGRGHDS